MQPVSFAWFRFFMILIGGLGIQVCVNALFGAIGYFKMKYDDESAFIWLSLAVFCPLLPVSLISSYLTVEYPGWTRWFRFGEAGGVMFSFCLSGACLCFVSLIEELSGLLVLGIIIGTLSAIQYCLLFGIVLQINSEGWYEMGLSFGFQGSCFITLFVKLVVGFQANSSIDVFSMYLLCIALIALLCCIGVYQFDRRELETIDYQLIEMGGIKNKPNTTPTTMTTSKDSTEKPNEEQNISYINLFWECRWIGLILFLSMFSSLVLFPFYSFVPSQSGDAVVGANFMDTLFYAKTISDTFSRPLSIVIKMGNEQQYLLLLMSVLRLVIGVPFFFIYVFDVGSFVAVNDHVFTLFIVIYSATSGLFLTWGYQMAPTANKTEKEIRIISAILNCCFQIGGALALIASIIIRYYLIL